MNTSHNVIESNRNPKRNLTGEAAISNGKNNFSPAMGEFQSCSRNAPIWKLNTLLSRNFIAEWVHQKNYCAGEEKKKATREKNPKF